MLRISPVFIAVGGLVAGCASHKEVTVVDLRTGVESTHTEDTKNYLIARSSDVQLNKDVRGNNAWIAAQTITMANGYGEEIQDDNPDFATRSRIRFENISCASDKQGQYKYPVREYLNINNQFGTTIGKREGIPAQCETPIAQREVAIDEVRWESLNCKGDFDTLVGRGATYGQVRLGTLVSEYGCAIDLTEYEFTEPQSVPPIPQPASPPRGTKPR